MRNKRAVSAVVATVLIILITIAAVTILWVAVIPMIKDKITGGTICLDALTDVFLVTNPTYTCIEGGNILIQVGRGAKDFELTEIQVLISVGGNTFTETIEAGLPGVNEERVFTIEGNYTGAERVQIAPVVKAGNIVKICDISSTVELDICKI